MLKSRPGIVYAEALTARDGEAYVYMVESEPGVDVRKSLFYALAEKNWPMIGLESLGMSLEDIFISVVDRSQESDVASQKPTERRRRGRRTLEGSLADVLVSDAEKKREDSDEETEE